jgi:hypothetical protein
MRGPEGGVGSTLEVRGAIEKVVFRSPSGYTVAKLRVVAAIEVVADAAAAAEPLVKKKKRPPSTLVTVVSSQCPLLATAVVGDLLLCRGTWTDDPKFGTQFLVQGSTSGHGISSSGNDGHGGEGGGQEAAACEIDAPSPAEATLAWLKSGALPGVGPATAARIVELFGDRAQEVLDGLADCSAEELRTHELLKVPKVRERELFRKCERPFQSRTRLPRAPLPF